MAARLGHCGAAAVVRAELHVDHAAAGEVLVTGTWSNSTISRAFQILYLALALGLILTRPGRRTVAILCAMIAVFVILMLRPVILGMLG